MRASPHGAPSPKSVRRHGVFPVTCMHFGNDALDAMSHRDAMPCPSGQPGLNTSSEEKPACHLASAGVAWTSSPQGGRDGSPGGIEDAAPDGLVLHCRHFDNPPARQETSFTRPWLRVGWRHVDCLHGLHPFREKSMSAPRSSEATDPVRRPDVGDDSAANCAADQAKAALDNVRKVTRRRLRGLGRTVMAHGQQCQPGSEGHGRRQMTATARLCRDHPGLVLNWLCSSPARPGSPACPGWAALTQPGTRRPSGRSAV